MDPMKGIYGVIVVILLFFIIQQLYSVYYTPGSTTLYNSPITQALFPGKKLHPTWGYDALGMYKGKTGKESHGQGEFWPESGQGYKPNRSGSGGPSPTGGERDPGPYIQPSIGWWGGDAVEPVTNTVQHIYDDKGIPEKKVWEIGWWGY